MLKSKLSKREKGFTIIEVLIVLAIAGLIMLIVFLAVPALQRNSRNTQRTSDASRVGAEVANWVSQNNGAVFTAGSSNVNLQAVIDNVGNMGQYTLTAGSTLTVATGVQAANTTVANIVIVTGASCGTSGATVAGSTRQIALQYATEKASGATGQGQCQNI